MSGGAAVGEVTRPRRRGLEIRCQRHSVSPSIAIRMWLVGGQLAEPAPGLALACGRLLTEGTAHRSWDEIVEAAERRGMDISGIGGAELIGLSIDALAEDWLEALELACELVREPTFPEGRCRWVRRQIAAELESLGEQPEVRTAWAFMEQLYGEHPWGRPRQGSRASLEAVEPGACAAFHRDSLARGVIVSVAGDIDEAAVRDLLVRRLSDLDREPVEAPTPPAPPPRIATSRRIALPQADQAQVLLGHLTVPVTDPDFVALELASVLLGSGPGLVGRIPERIRERDGLAYAASVSATSGAGSAPGRLVVHAGTAPERAPRLIEAVRDELGRLIEGGLRDEELDEARRYILGSDPFRRETARQLVALMAQAALFGIPLDDAGWLARAIGELDRPAVEAVLRAHLDPDRLAVTVGLPASR